MQREIPTETESYTTMWQQSMPHIAWGSIALFIGIVVAYIWVISAALAGSVPYYFATFVCIYLCFASFTIQHDAGHGSIFTMGSRFKFIEVIMGWLASLPLLVSPYRLFQKIHDRHHAFTNDPDRDPDHFKFGNKWYQVLLGIYFMPIKYHLMSLTTLRHIKVFRDTYASTVVYMCFTMSTLILLSINGYGMEVLWFAIVPNLINIFVLVMFFDYVPHHPHKSQGRYHNTRIYPSRLLNVLLLGQNYHLIHHLYPRLPWYRYRQVFLKIRPDLEAHEAPIDDLKSGTLSDFIKSPFASKLQDGGKSINRLLEVSKIEPLCEGSVAVSFKLPAGEKLHYKAGQYITLSKWLAGEQRTRCYSLCTSPNKGVVQIAVRQTTNGLVSKYINTNLKMGDELIIQGPYGDFTYPAKTPGKTQSLVLIAGGSGITPILAILETALAEQKSGKIHLIYACHSWDSIMFLPQIQDMQNNHQDRFKVDFVISAHVNKTLGVHGRIDKQILESLLSFDALPKASEFYICGPEGLKSTVIKTLDANNIANEHIYVEQFVAETIKPKGKLFIVKLKLADGKEQELHVAANQSVLAVAKAESVMIPHACESGSCGSCKFKVEQGKVAPIDNCIASLTADEKTAGFTLACQCKPLSDLSLSLA